MKKQQNDPTEVSVSSDINSVLYMQFNVKNDRYEKFKVNDAESMKFHGSRK